MFLMISGHMGHPIPSLEHGGTSTSGLEITVFSRKYVDIIVFRTISDEYTSHANIDRSIDFIHNECILVRKNEFPTTFKPTPR